VTSSNQLWSLLKISVLPSGSPNGKIGIVCKAENLQKTQLHGQALEDAITPASSYNESKRLLSEDDAMIKWIIAGLVLLIILTGCKSEPPISSEFSGTEVQQEFSDLPSIPLNDIQRYESAATQRQRLGMDYYIKADAASELDPDLLLIAPPQDICWAIYEFNDTFFDLGDSWLELGHEVLVGGDLFVGLSNFAESRWNFQNVSLGTGNQQTDFQIPQGSAYTSSSSKTYIAVIPWDSMATKVVKLELKLGVPNLAPSNLLATDGIWGDLVVLTWDTVPHCYGYDIICKRSDQDETAWAVLGHSDGNENSTFEHTYDHPPGACAYNTSYDYYAVATYNDGDYSEPSNIDSGFRLLQPPTSLRASQNLYDDKVVVDWYGSKGAKEYVVYASEDDVDYTEVGSASEFLWSFNYSTGENYGDVFFKVAGRIPGDATGEPSSAVTGSALGWDISVISGDAANTYDSDAAVVDGKLAAAYYSVGWDYLIFSHALVDRPDSPFDWEHSDVLRSSAFRQVKAGELDGWPAVVFTDDDNEILSFSVATARGDAWYEFTTTVVEPYSVDKTIYNADWHEIDGRVALAYRTNSSSANDLVFAYSTDTTPILNGDWTEYQLSPTYTGSRAMALDIILGKPAILFRFDTGNDCHYAYADSLVPTSSDGWTISECTTSQYPVYHVDMVKTIDQFPLIGVQSLPNNDYYWDVNYEAATISSPTQESDWIQAGSIDQGDGGNLGYFSMHRIGSHIAVAYLDQDAGKLQYDISTEYTPSSDNDWSRMTIDSPWHITKIDLVDYDGLPAIVFNDAETNEVKLALGK
jgi:hypothetical protein